MAFFGTLGLASHCLKLLEIKLQACAIENLGERRWSDGDNETTTAASFRSWITWRLSDVYDKRERALLYRSQRTENVES